MVEPRLILQHGAPCAPSDDLRPRRSRRLPHDHADGARPRAGATPTKTTRTQRANTSLCQRVIWTSTSERTVLDWRGRSPLATIADARQLPVLKPQSLVICADTPRRLAALASRRGGFALISHDSLLEEPELLADFEHMVVLDPPASPTQDATQRDGARGTPTWHGAKLSYALLSRCTSWSTVSVLRL